ncbi:MAG: serine/threonine protein kinase, partial [Pirellula sp.]|nr:serine/threonine protein kinase [Pirellula sp.]
MNQDSPSSDDQRPPERIVSVRAWTDFEIVNHHQEGGLGIVYRALDRNLNREVALKVIRGKGVNDPETRAQFEKEIEITGRLEHPGIAPVYARGLSAEGNPFYAMRFVDGHDLSEEIDSFFELATPDFSSVGFHRLLNTLISVCQTVAYAHGRGVIHRDIKPLNIRIGKFSETILLDWGLATVVERSDQLRSHDESTLILSSRTSSSASGGTPAYMSPEQLSGLSASPASDVYSLGAVLYRILTGKSTTETIPGFQIREALLEGRIIPPRDVHPKVPRPLQAICLKALALHPKSRFESAIEMATELERYIAGQPILCYKESLLERYNRWGRNHRMMIRFLGVCLLLATVFSLFMAITTLRLAESRNKQRMQAEVERSEAVRSKSIADIANRRSLQLAAQLGARSIATEIELRVSQLREEATQPLLRNWVFKLNKDPDDRKSTQELNSWLKDRFLLRVSEKMPTSTWIVQNAEGLQIGRVATREADGNASSLGKNFRFRDYFHAQGEDLQPDSLQANDTKPHRFDV